MIESELEKKLGKQLKDLGCLYFKFISPGNTGVPDRLIILPGGCVIFVELKTESGRLTPLQRRDRVCAQEVFQEAFGGDLKHMRQADTREINRVIRSSGEWKNAYTGMSFGYCGRGRGFARKSEADQ